MGEQERKPKILIAVTNCLIRTNIAMFLQEEEHLEIIVAANNCDAVAKLKGGMPISLVLLDRKIEEMSNVKMRNSITKMAFVAIDNSKVDTEFFDYVLEPFGMDHLLHMLNTEWLKHVQ